MSTEQEKQEQEKQDLFPDFEVTLDEIPLPEEEEAVEDSEIEVDEDNTEQETTFSEDADDDAVGLYKTLLEKDIIFEDEEDPFDGTWGSLEKRLDKLPEMIAGSIIQQMPEPVQNLMDFALTKGDVNLQDLQEFFQLQVDDANASDVKVESIQDARKYLANVMRQQEYEPDVIDTTLDAMEDKGEEYIINKAKGHAQKNQSQKAQARLMQEKQQKQVAMQQQQEYFSKLNTELESYKYTAKKNRAIRENLDPNIIAQKNAAIGNSPKAIIQLADFYSYFDPKTGSFNLDAYAKSASSNNVKDFKNNLMKKHFSSGGTKSSGKGHQKTEEGDELVPIF